MAVPIEPPNGRSHNLLPRLGVDLTLAPPLAFVRRRVVLVVVDGTRRHGKFIADREELARFLEANGHARVGARQSAESAALVTS
jgi:hypothetical protein